MSEEKPRFKSWSHGWALEVEFIAKDDWSGICCVKLPGAEFLDGQRLVLRHLKHLTPVNREALDLRHGCRIDDGKREKIMWKFKPEKGKKLPR